MTAPSPLVQLARRAPRLPAAVVDQLLAAAAAEAPLATPDGQAQDLPSTLALLRRHDVPLSRLSWLPGALCALPPTVAAAYLERPEHTAAEVVSLLEDLLTVNPGSRVVAALCRSRKATAATSAAAFARAGTDELDRLMQNPAAPATLRARAAVALLEAAAAAPDPDEGAFARKEVLDYLASRSAALANALVMLVDDAELLALSADMVSSQAAVDRVVTGWLVPYLHGDLSGEDAVRSVRHSCERLGLRSSPHVRAQLAAALRRASAFCDERRPRSEDILDLACDLLDVDVLDRPWQALRAGSGTDDGVDVAARIVAELGEDPAAWAVYAQLGDTFPGTLGQLLRTVQLVAADPAQLSGDLATAAART